MINYKEEGGIMTKKWKDLLMVITIALAAVYLVGCATYQPTQEKKQSSFLGDYPAFKEGKEGVDKVYLKEGVDFGQYNKIMLDEVVFYLKTDADDKGIKPSEINELSMEFNEAFVEALNEAYPLTDTAGPDVMRIRIAITDLELSSPVGGTMSTIIPVGLAYSLVKKGATGEYAGIGSATMEADFLDSTSNQRIAAAIDKKPGGKFDVGKLSPTKSAFKFWAKRLKAFLDDVHGKK
jgi:hypothetical protein